MALKAIEYGKTVPTAVADLGAIGPCASVSRKTEEAHVKLQGAHSFCSMGNILKSTISSFRDHLR